MQAARLLRRAGLHSPCRPGADLACAAALVVSKCLSSCCPDPFEHCDRKLALQSSRVGIEMPPGAIKGQSTLIACTTEMGHARLGNSKQGKALCQQEYNKSTLIRHEIHAQDGKKQCQAWENLPRQGHKFGFRPGHSVPSVNPTHHP